MYFESTDGGMDTTESKGWKNPFNPHRWMQAGCRVEDEALLEWMGVAEVGQLFNHRMGCCVRLKDLYVQTDMNRSETQETSNTPSEIRPPTSGSN